MDEELGARRDALLGAAVGEGFGERGEAFRSVDDEGWGLALRLEVVGGESVEEAGEGGGGGGREGEGGEEGEEGGGCVRGGEVGKALVDGFFEGGDEVDAGEGAGELG